MKSLLATTAVLAAINIAPSAHAQSAPGDWYVSIFSGASNIGSIDTNYYNNTYDVEHGFDNSYIIGLTVGREIRANLRGEIELSYASYEGGDVVYNYNGGSFSYPTTGDASTTYLMANFWFNLSNFTADSAFTPYIGGGVGVVRLDADTKFDTFNFGYGDSLTGLAYQVGFGVRFPVGNNSGIDVGYRMKAASGLDISDNDGDGVYEDGEYMSNNFQIAYIRQF